MNSDIKVKLAVYEHSLKVGKPAYRRCSVVSANNHIETNSPNIAFSCHDYFVAFTKLRM